MTDTGASSITHRHIYFAGTLTVWLAWVARQMGRSRDLSWWDIPTWIPHWKLHLLRGLVVGLSMGAAAAFVAQSVIGLIVGHRVGLVATISVAVLVGVAGGMGPKYGAGLRRPPRIIVPRMLYLRDFSPLVATGILVCLGMALVIGSSTSLVSILVTRSASRASTGFIVGFVAEIVLAIAIGFAFALGMLWSIPTPAFPSAKPASTYRADLRASLIAGLMGGLAAALAAGVGAALEFGPVFGLEVAPIFGLAVGLIITLITSQAQLLKLAQLILTLQGRTRIHFLPFLEEALQIQLLRQAGPVYQFRHAVLQDRLTKMRSLRRS